VDKRNVVYIIMEYYSAIKKDEIAELRWLTPVILASWEAEIRKIAV
jgi:hypothetical protein